MVGDAVMKLVVDRIRDCFYYLKTLYPELVGAKGAWRKGESCDY